MGKQTDPGIYCTLQLDIWFGILWVTSGILCFIYTPKQRYPIAATQLCPVTSSDFHLQCLIPTPRHRLWTRVLLPLQFFPCPHLLLSCLLLAALLTLCLSSPHGHHKQSPVWKVFANPEWERGFSSGMDECMCYELVVSNGTFTATLSLCLLSMNLALASL